MIKRDELIRDALWHVRALPPDGRVSLELLRRATRLLNNVIRQDNLKLTGDNRALWATDSAGLFLVGDSHIYGVSQGLRPDAQEVFKIVLRSDTGDDTPVKMISQSTYTALPNKNEQGDTTAVFIREALLPSENVWFLNQVKNGTAEVPDKVIADGQSWECIQAHTSDDDSRPGGQSGDLYWQLSRGDATTDWVNATAYVNGDMLYYSFKRPLANFENAYSNPDMPEGWEGYLTFKLALQMSAGRNLPEKDIIVIGRLLKQAEQDIFPSRKETGTDTDNKGMYF